MQRISLLFLLLTVGCTNQKQATEQSTSDTAAISTEPINTLRNNHAEQRSKLTDTTTNGVTIKFLEFNLEMTDEAFDSLRLLSKRTELPLKSADKRITRLDSCIKIKLDNGRIDSLCNKDDGEYFEKYVINGVWDNENLLLVNFQNWEESHDFFINLADGSYYILTPFYEVSPKLDLIISYVDISASPIYSSELLVTKVQKGTLTTLLKWDLGQLTITDATWLSNSDCLISTGVVGDGTDNIKDKKKYLMRIE